MKKLLAALLLIMLTSTGLAAPADMTASMKNTRLHTEITVRAMPLADFLALLGKESGLKIVAVPEAADMKISLSLPPDQSLEQIFAALQTTYHLYVQPNVNNTALIVTKGSYLFETAPVSRFSQKTSLAAAPSILPGGCYLPLPQGDGNTEEYGVISDNGIHAALHAPLSTFSIDVDTAAYSNLRRYVNAGVLPPADAVRTEEMINYFNYDYPQPSGEHPFSVTAEVGDCPWNPGHKLALIGLQGKRLNNDAMPASNLVFLIDVSGSMNQPNKLPLLKTAFRMLVAQLRPEDTVSIVVYAGAAGVALEPTSGQEKSRILRALDSLQPGGSTAGGEGIALAYKIAKNNYVRGGNNRVILATDGDFNIGLTSESELAKLIEQHRNDGIYLSVLGFGMGNIKDNKMETLADKGNGNYAYIDNAAEARKVLVSQMAGTLYTIAADVKLQVEFNPAKVKYYRLIGYENRLLADSDFNNDHRDAGDLGAGQAVTALYEIIPAASDETAANIDQLIYQQPTLLPSNEYFRIKLRYKKPAAKESTLFSQSAGPANCLAKPSDNLTWAAAVSEYALLLRNSEFKGKASYEQVLGLAKTAKGEDAEGYRREFIRLVEITQLLAGQ